MASRTIESPGVEIRERDLSLVASLPVGTNIFVQGFAAQGPTDELLNVTSSSELEQIYGLPTNAAERYFYHTARQVLNSPGNLLVNRLPYGPADGEGYADYSALLYSINGLSGGVSGVSSVYTESDYYNINEPQLVTLTQKQYMNIKSGQVDWTTSYVGEPDTSVSGSDIYSEIGKAGLVILNSAKTAVNENYEGYFVAITDNSVIGDDVFDSVRSVTYKDPTYGSWQDIPETVLEFDLTGTNMVNPGSMSEVLESIPTFDGFSTDAYKDSIVIQLYKVRTTLYGSSITTTLDMVPTESFDGSFDSRRKWTPPTGGEESYFIGNSVNRDSNYMDVYINPNIASRGGSWTAGSPDGGPMRSVRVADGVRKSFAIGPTVYSSNLADKVIGSMTAKLDRSLRLAENKEQIPIDIVVDGGLSTIWANIRLTDPTDMGEFNDTVYLKGVQDPVVDGATDYLGHQTNGSGSEAANSWETIFNKLNGFVSQTRRDCLLIADPLRNIFVQGRDSKVLGDPTKNFSQHVYWPLKNLIAATNSNYACTYANWGKAYDNELGDFVWLPFSGFEANIMANLDANLQPWYAAAGLNNGIVRGIVDIGINPTQRQRDLLYKINANPVVFFPGDGYTVWGQKTLQKKPSAFDRINVRRLFIVLQKATLSIMRYFVFEPNTVFTRTRVVNVLTPIFDIAKNNEGLYDYLIVCDERNNTPNVIDNNELVVDIYLKPVRIAEFILCNFIATRTDQDFTELI